MRLFTLFCIFCDREWQDFYLASLVWFCLLQAANGNKFILDMVTPIVKANLDDFLRKPCLSFQNSSIDMALLISPIAIAAKDEFKSTYKSTCSRGASNLEFCRGLKALKEFSEIGAQKLNRLLDPKVSLNITERACSKYIDRIGDVIMITVKKYSNGMDSKKIGCYLFQIVKTSENFKKKINDIGEKFRENSQREFEKIIKNQLRDINDFKSNVQKKFLACLMSPDIEKCLKKYAEVN